MWQDAIGLSMERDTKNIICSLVVDLERSNYWKLYACYGSPYYKDKKGFLRGLIKEDWLGSFTLDNYRIYKQSDS